MWQWSGAIAERAAVAGWTRSPGEPAPTITDPETWAEVPHRDGTEPAGAPDGAARVEGASARPGSECGSGGDVDGDPPGTIGALPEYALVG